MNKKYLIVFSLVLFLTACTSKKEQPTLTPRPTLSPTVQPSPTPVWKTYTSPDFSIQYPRQWRVATDSAYVSLYNPATMLQESTQFVGILTIPSSQTATQYVDDLLKNNSVYSVVPKDKLGRKSITISGRPAEMIIERASIDPMTEGQGNAIYLSTGKKIFYIHTSAKSATSSAIASQVLATFILK
ncbi:MAG: hypothetical protein M3Q44_07010 [bacterium]|nr:hypothetical protein [bacterium]